MAYKTKLQVVTKIERDLDLEEEEFIQPDEMTEIINDGITIIEAHMNTLGLRDQYFLTRTTLNLVNGTADYSLPTNLYEGKIKEVIYSNGATIYGVKPLTGSSSAEEIAHLNRFSTTEYYRYRIRNDSSSAIYFQLIPAARETATGVIIIEHFRDLARVSADADLVEVPEIALQFLYQFIRVKVYEKEGSALLPMAKEDLQKIEELMIATLQGQLADDSNNYVEMDKSIFEEHS
jgi:AAA+ ATPase superfamily predicted ATPase